MTVLATASMKLDDRGFTWSLLDDEALGGRGYLLEFSHTLDLYLISAGTSVFTMRPCVHCGDILKDTMLMETNRCLACGGSVPDSLTGGTQAALSRGELHSIIHAVAGEGLDPLSGELVGGWCVETLTSALRSLGIDGGWFRMPGGSALNYGYTHRVQMTEQVAFTNRDGEK